MTLHNFLDTSYTAFHTVKNTEQILLQNGFEQLHLEDKWQLQPQGKYYVIENDSSIVAFRIGDNKVFNIVESHTDSPSFKIKGGTTIQGNGVVRLNTEKYGGGLLYTFFDRPLKIAGRLLVKTANGIESKVVTSNYNVVIPSMCIHHNPQANDGFAVNAQIDTLPLFGTEANNLYQTLTDDEVVDADLFVTPATTTFTAGATNEFLCSARIDNLSSVYTSVQALVNATPSNICICACLDNEEIGSGTRQGSPKLIQRIVDHICHALGLTTDQQNAAYHNGFVLSVDNGHAVHPAHPEKSDPVAKAYMGKGVVIKHHVNYSTDGLTSALFKCIAQQANVPTQDYYNNSAVRCGSTLGLATSQTLGMKTCDIGLAQLAMHSACETVAVCDVDSMQNVLTTFFDAPLCGNKVN